MPTDDVLAIVGRADELYRRRATAGSVRESIMVLSGALSSEERYEVQWRLARALFFLGQEAATRDDRAQLHQSGVEAGKRAIALNQDRVEGHFWAGVNLALFAGARRRLAALRPLLWARSELRLAVHIREGYHDAGPLRCLARLEHQAPAILGGSQKLSREHYDRALSVAPNNSVTLLYAAELAEDAGERTRAIELLERLIELPIDSDWEYENVRDKKLAEQMLARIGVTRVG